MALATRDLMDSLRSAGEITGGPKPFAPRDRSAFLSALDQTIVRLKRAGSADSCALWRGTRERLALLDDIDHAELCRRAVAPSLWITRSGTVSAIRRQRTTFSGWPSKWSQTRLRHIAITGPGASGGPP